MIENFGAYAVFTFFDNKNDPFLSQALIFSAMDHYVMPSFFVGARVFPGAF